MRPSRRRPKAAPPIAIVVEEPAWRAPGLVALLRRAAKRALEAAGTAAEGEISILLADDETLHRLNLQFRGKDKPTNVLSFPAAENPAAHLGDIAMAYGVAAAEAKAAGRPLADHAAHLAVHGVLHLLGYDHETDEDAAEMEPMETTILAKLGISDPYALREAA